MLTDYVVDAILSTPTHPYQICTPSNSSILVEILWFWSEYQNDISTSSFLSRFIAYVLPSALDVTEFQICRFLTCSNCKHAKFFLSCTFKVWFLQGLRRPHIYLIRRPKQGTNITNSMPRRPNSASFDQVESVMVSLCESGFAAIAGVMISALVWVLSLRHTLGFINSHRNFSFLKFPCSKMYTR